MSQHALISPQSGANVTVIAGGKISGVKGKVVQGAGSKTDPNVVQAKVFRLTEQFPVAPPSDAVLGTINAATDRYEFSEVQGAVLGDNNRLVVWARFPPPPMAGVWTTTTAEFKGVQVGALS